jgi:hypothetical protein
MFTVAVAVLLASTPSVSTTVTVITLTPGPPLVLLYFTVPSTV